MSHSSRNNSRRDVLKGLAVGVAASAAMPAAARAGISAPPRAERAGAPEHWALLAPVEPGTHLGLGWHAGRLDLAGGAWILTLASAEQGLARVSICYRSGAPRGLAHTELLDLVLMDGGAGDQRTEESVGRVVMGLAALLRRNELVHADRFAALLTHDERVERYGPESL
jgi:hypothetical protein